MAAGPFLAVVEHAFTTPTGITQEVNLLFAVDAGELDPRGPVPSCEDHLEFVWVDCTAAQLKSVNLQPWVLQQALAVYGATGRMDPFLTTIGG